MTDDKERLILSMKDDVVSALSHAKQKTMSESIIKGLESIIEGLGELEPLITKPIHQKRVRVDLKKVIEELKDSSEKGNEGLTQGQMRILRDKVNVLKTMLPRM